MKTIILTNGMATFVDDEDFKKLSKYVWMALKGRNTFYAHRRVYLPKGKGKYITVYMHREILGLTISNAECDHKDRNGLNNQRHNLRSCTRSENARNRAKTKNYKQSSFKGVSYDARRNKWGARIGINSKQTKLGNFNSEIEAAHAYDKAALKHYGEFARGNFI